MRIDIEIDDIKADGYVISCGDFNIVFIRTKNGLLGCGAFNVEALDKLNYPAACVAGKDGKLIANIDDVVEGKVKVCNRSAYERGISPGMLGREALHKL